jgi:hypothetical protein
VHKLPILILPLAACNDIGFLFGDHFFTWSGIVRHRQASSSTFTSYEEALKMLAAAVSIKALGKRSGPFLPPCQNGRSDEGTYFPIWSAAGDDNCGYRGSGAAGTGTQSVLKPDARFSHGLGLHPTMFSLPSPSATFRDEKMKRKIKDFFWHQHQATAGRGVWVACTGVIR